VIKDDAVYLTPTGRDSLTSELQHLLRNERPSVVETVSWAASNGDRSENGDYLYGKKRLREIDRRVRYLRHRLKRAVVIDPATSPHHDQVFFGASVTVIDDDDKSTTVQLVGVDEAQPANGRINWRSPVGRALLKGKVGDVVSYMTPAGERSLEIVSIRYGGPEPAFPG
jgi:transcription elongation factor GreB